MQFRKFFVVLSVLSVVTPAGHKLSFQSIANADPGPGGSCTAVATGWDNGLPNCQITSSDCAEPTYYPVCTPVSAIVETIEPAPCNCEIGPAELCMDGQYALTTPGCVTCFDGSTAKDTTSCPGDDDNDGIANHSDNCGSTANAGQEDDDGDGMGDSCDNCISTSNSDQADSNGDGIGDACSDSDFDGAYDTVDNCPADPNPEQADTDGDGIGDLCDPDPDDPNSPVGQPPEPSPLPYVEP
jgi:hypothetical protein